MRKPLFLGSVAAFSLAGAALAGPAFTITPIVLEGDSVSGVGNVTTIDNLSANNNGDWIVEADTDAASETDSVLLRNGSLYLREGDPVDPAGATIGSFDSVNINILGNSGWNFFLDGTSGLSDDSGIYYNSSLVIQESNISTAPQFSPGTPYIGFFDIKINDNDVMFAVSSIDDPNINSTVDRAIVRIEPDGFGGWTENVILKEEDFAPGLTETITDFGTDPHESAYNNNGDALYAVDLTGDTTANAAVYLNDTMLAREGEASPVPGRNWSSLTSIKVDLTEDGQYVFTGSLDGDTTTNSIIIKNGDKFIQEGDSLAAIGEEFAFTSFGTGPVYISDGGDVLWYGDWNNSDTTVDEGLFLNDMLLVQEGVTEVDGVLVDTLRGVQDGYFMSNNGVYILFEAVLADGTDGAFMIVIPEPASVVLLAIGAFAVVRRRR